MTIVPKKVNAKEYEKHLRRERKLFGATVQEILEEEAKKNGTDLESFLVSNEGKKRIKEIEKVLGVLLEKEPGKKELSAGAPGLGKRKS